MSQNSLFAIDDSRAIARSVNSDLRIEIHPFDAALSGRCSRSYWSWLELFERDAACRITDHPEQVIGEAAHSPKSRGRRGFLVNVMQNDQVLGAGALVPKDVRTSKVGGIGPAWTLHGYRLVGDRFLGGQDHRIQQTLMDAISTQLVKQRADFLLIEDLEEQETLWDVLQSLTRQGFRLFLPTGLQDRHRILLPDNLDEFWEQFSSKSRGKLRRKVKKFGEARLVRVTEIEQIVDFLRDAKQISQNTWQADTLGLRVAGDEQELEIFTFLAERRALRSYLLYRGKTPAAFIIGHQYNGCFHQEEIGHDREFSKLRAGTVLLLKVLEDVITHDRPAIYDFGLGDAEYKRQFSNQTTRSSTVWLMPPGVKAGWFIAHLKTCQAARRRLRALLQRSGFWVSVRRLVQRRS